MEKQTMRAVLTVCLAVIALGAGCTGGEGGGGGSARDGGAGGAGGGAGGAPDGPPTVRLNTGLPGELALDGLGEGGLQTLCNAVGVYEAHFAAQLKPLRCLEQGIATALVGTQDPATCVRLEDVCNLIPMEADVQADRCMTDFQFRWDYCRPSTVAQFEACVARNVALEREAADNAALGCVEGVRQGTVLPEGMWDCACNQPRQYGRIPADDPDRDGVPDPADRCPDTAPYAEVSEAGCSAFQDQDQDGVPNLDDECPGSQGPGTPDGCDRRQDPDQDGVRGPRERCPETEAGAAVNEWGCSVAQDDDQDGWPDEVDPCPGSNPALEINAAGCDRAQDWDNDGVPNETDLCPGSDPEAFPGPTGCDRNQDQDRDGVPNETDLCPDSLFEAVGPTGCSVQQDRDQDGVPNRADRCPETRDGDAVSPVGCSAAQDEDGDSVPTVADACPGTPVGEGVDPVGCTPGQYMTLGQPVAELPPNTRSFVFQGAGGPPVTLHAPETLTEDGGEVINVKGVMYLDLGEQGYLPLPRADVRFQAAGDQRVSGMSGQADVAVPGLDLFNGVRINEPARASVGLGTGESLLGAGVDAPLRPERSYVVFRAEAGLSATVGPVDLLGPFGAEVLLVLDPLDPGFFGRFDVRGFSVFRYLRDVGVGLSAQGLLPFEPWEAGAFREGMAPIEAFEGHMLVEGTLDLGGRVPLPGLVLNVNGQAVVDFSADGGGLDLDPTRARMGLNGEFEVGVNFLDEFVLTFPVARGTASFGDPRLGRKLVLVGNIGVNELRFPRRIPFRQELALVARIEAGRSIEDLSLFLGGDLILSREALGALNIGIEARDVRVSGSVRANVDGVTLTGSIDQSPLDQVELRGVANITASFPFWGDWEVRLEGDMLFFGEPVQRLSIGSNGIDVD
ncbi:MAG: thrombospondin type 3 repeat-containing protein [Myxococcales bacterium]|nr:thrombospondin type 3 repeat-containing protein [Myxococcales bacterium]